MEQEIKIFANIKSLDTCIFKIDRPILPNDVAYFSTKEDGKDSPLAEAIFSLNNIRYILFSHNIVKVCKGDWSDWTPIAQNIGELIRKHLQSGEPLFSNTKNFDAEQDENIKTKVHELLNTQINPAVAQHGGNIQLVDVKNRVVLLQFGGGCLGCGMVNLTLKNGVERVLRHHVPEIVDILDITDHTLGRNPYYPTM